MLSAVENLNLIYGGQEQVISHVVYTNAGLDPWIGHGVSEYGLVESTAIYLQCEYLDDKSCASRESITRLSLFKKIDAAAGADLSSISSEEPIELTRAKQLITEYLTRWADNNPEM